MPRWQKLCVVDYDTMIIQGISAPYKQNRLITLVISIGVRPILIPTPIILVREINLILDGEEISLVSKSLKLKLSLELECKYC